MRSLIPLSLLLFSLDVYAARIPFKSRTKRASISSGNGEISIVNTQNAEYIANITLGGRSIPVLLDTGSSDLWVTGSVPGTTDTGTGVQISYAVGEAAGNVNTATLGFDNYTVQDQAYLLVTDTSSFSTDISQAGYEGLVGLGPKTGSVIWKNLDKGDAGAPMLDRIFEQNKTTQNFITLLLNRETDETQNFAGEFTVSELVPSYTNITSQTKLTVDKVLDLTKSDQHWQVYTDVNGVIGPDGQPIQTDSIVPKAPDGQLIAVFDSGFTLPQVPRSMSDAIYGRVQGAEYNTNMQAWTIPCGQELNISFKFGGQTFPVHPLDTSSSDFDIQDSNGNTVCVGTFQPISSAFSILGEYDMIMGMGFMRNAYTLVDFGDFVSDTSNDRGDPFMQLLSITNTAQAHQQFVKARLNGVDTTGASQYTLLPASQEQHSPETAAEKKAALEEKVLSRWPEILVGALVLFLLIIGCCVWRCCCGGRKPGMAALRRQKRQRNAMGSISRIRPNSTPGYAPLDESSMYMQPRGPYQTGYAVHA